MFGSIAKARKTGPSFQYGVNRSPLSNCAGHRARRTTFCNARLSFQVLQGRSYSAIAWPANHGKSRFSSRLFSNPFQKQALTQSGPQSAVTTRTLVTERPNIDVGKDVKRPTWDGQSLVLMGNRQLISQRWLRDHCFCQDCFHVDSKQRLYNGFKVASPKISQCVEREDDLEILWNDGHRSIYLKAWLDKHNERHADARIRQGDISATLWESNILDQLPSVDYGTVMASAEALKKWLVKIREYGFCFVDGCPPTAEATQALLERIAFIRQTHYGGYWESTADMQSIDTAYTNLSLDVHTDTTYFSDPVGLEMFHILSHEGGEGGETILVDGFRAAAALLNQDLGYYNLLSSVKLHHHASGDDGINFVAHRGFPVLELDDETSQLMRIRWNNADRAAIDCPVHMKDQWYHAAQAFHNHLTQAGSEIKLKLVPGRPLIFDNWRVLHGRTSFTGNRRLGGGYINHDDFISRFKQLHYQKAQILNATLTG